MCHPIYIHTFINITACIVHLGIFVVYFSRFTFAVTYIQIAKDNDQISEYRRNYYDDYHIRNTFLRFRVRQEYLHRKIRNDYHEFTINLNYIDYSSIKWVSTYQPD